VCVTTSHWLNVEILIIECDPDCSETWTVCRRYFVCYGRK